MLNAAIWLIANAALQAQTMPSPDNFKKAAEYSHSQHGTGVLVMVRGEILFEDYAPGWTAEKPHLLASGTKSFCGVMAACAVHDGLLTLDERVADTLVEWKDDPRKSRITIRQLLSLSSGIDGGDNNGHHSHGRKRRPRVQRQRVSCKVVVRRKSMSGIRGSKERLRRN